MPASQICDLRQGSSLQGRAATLQTGWSVSLEDSLSVLRNPCWTIKSMPEYQDVLTTASQLSVTDRLRLIDDLASSVPDDQPPHLSEEWLTEIRRRSEEIDSGTVQTESWTVIRDRLFARHGVSDGR